MNDRLENDRRKDFMIDLHNSYVGKLAIQLVIPVSAIRRNTDDPVETDTVIFLGVRPASWTHNFARGRKKLASVSPVDS